MIEIKKFSELTTKELYEILKIRSEVFVVEQKILYNDMDDKDLQSFHIMLKENEQIKAYLRVLPSGLSYQTPALGRVLVSKDSRRKGYGEKIILAGIKCVSEILKEDKITISAQEYISKLYEKLGFIKISDVYIEEGIPHVKMQYNIDRKRAIRV